jgi:hypothetical protein
MSIWETLISHTEKFSTTNLSTAHTMRCAVTWSTKPKVMIRTAEIKLIITSHKRQEVGNELDRYFETCLDEEHILWSANVPLALSKLSTLDKSPLY